MSQLIQRTFYASLGLDVHDHLAAIRGAYRDLAHRLHPARTGPGGRANFRPIDEAYRVLSDATLRRRYDEARSRDHDADVPRAAPETPEPLAPPPEVLSLRSATPFTRLSEAMFARFARNFTGIGVPKSESVDCLHVRFVIAPREAEEGMALLLGLPVLVRCDGCAGRGETGLVQCHACEGAGLVEAERTVEVTVAPGGAPSAEQSLTPLGIYNFFLQALVRIDPGLN